MLKYISSLLFEIVTSKFKRFQIIVPHFKNQILSKIYWHSSDVWYWIKILKHFNMKNLKVFRKRF